MRGDTELKLHLLWLRRRPRGTVTCSTTTFPLHACCGCGPVSEAFALALVLSAGALPGHASSLRISAGSNARVALRSRPITRPPTYSSTRWRGSVPITIFFDPQVSGVETAEVFTNLNRRDRATLRAAGGIEEGITPPNGNSIAPGNNSHYFAAYTMNHVTGGYQ